MIVYIIRHGETLANASGRIQGQTDSPLSPRGLQQCQRVAEALGSSRIEAVFSSPLRRARDSALPLAKALNLEVQLDDRLLEINAGIFQGLAWDEIGQRYPAEAAKWRSHDPDFVIPDGESRRGLMERAEVFFRQLPATGYEQVAVVAHGGILAAALKALLEVPARRNPFALNNGSISRLSIDGQASSNGDVKLLTLNDTAHLSGAAGNGGVL